MRPMALPASHWDAACPDHTGSVMAATYKELGPVRRLVLGTGRLRPVSRFSARVMHHLDKPVYRLSGGRTTLAGAVGGLPVVLLTTIGARTGQARTWPLLGFRDGERTVVLASNYGQPHHPAWYHNLRVEPRAVLEVNGVRLPVVAAEAEGTERERLWRAALDVYPAWSEYERWARPRRIPILVLTPTGCDGA